MLIFDGFSTRAHAERFAAAVEAKYGREAIVCDGDDDDDELLDEEYPFETYGIVVMVERLYPIYHKKHAKVEDALAEMVKEYQGEFAGT